MSNYLLQPLTNRAFWLMNLFSRSGSENFLKCGRITLGNFFRQPILSSFQTAFQDGGPMPGGQAGRILSEDFDGLAKTAENFRLALVPERVFNCDRQKPRPLHPSGENTQTSLKMNRAFAGVRKTSLWGDG